MSDPWKQNSLALRFRKLRNYKCHLCHTLPVPGSAWLYYLISCGICGHFGPRREVESELHHHCRPDIMPLDQRNWEYYFNSGLEYSVYSLMLQYNADPNAHPTPFTTAWADFVRFAIKYPSRVTLTKSYLKTLDDFFKHGADLGVSTVGLTLRPGDTSSHLPLRMITGWSTFCEALEDLTGSETEELKFISQITIRMIKQAISTQWPVRRLPSIIKRVFPEALYQPMLDMIFESQVRGNSFKTPSKRPSEEETSAERGNKRLKPYSADVTMS
ncbi:hypothetical protein F4781DRAFT_139540 [Annulohypoxylon bovei var. microspora]|nr:hypothetical protein F4781DRAFT_139540 [Annulohypoxylon bovei var. microspora]